jgi:hypothetical protein
VRDPIHTTECEVIYTHAYVHADISNTNICTYLHSSAQRNSIYHAQACPTTTHSYEKAMYCTHSSVRSVELWASAVTMCCAPSVPMKLFPRLYARARERRTIQRTCIAHDARSRAYNRVRGHIRPCIRARRYIKYKHACMPDTYTYLPVQNATAILYTTLLCTHTGRLCTALT